MFLSRLQTQEVLFISSCDLDAQLDGAYLSGNACNFGQSRNALSLSQNSTFMPFFFGIFFLICIFKLVMVFYNEVTGEPTIGGFM